MRNPFRRPFSRVEIGALSASAAALAFGLAHADTPHMLGNLFGLAPQEAVRISIASSNLPALKLDTIKGESSACFAAIKIFMADGSVALQSDFIKIMPGVATSHDLKFEDLKKIGEPKGFEPNALATDFTNRVQLRVASYLSATGISDHKLENKVGICNNEHKHIKLGLEVFDTTTGRTSFMVPTESLLPAVQ